MKNTNEIFKGNLSITKKVIIWGIKKPWGKQVHRISMIFDKRKYSMGDAATIGGIQFYSVTFRGENRIPVWGSPVIRVIVDKKLYIVR